ncbi:MAG TPA: MupA/Atu3671 family FMN-dependent luciferase-like monooxygenase [Blastocatellia bacterium]|nr:MupA/Atu3671 family FMN-dependent luciferase-like monooxygenase [Blastocatellia bacterium]
MFDPTRVVLSRQAEESSFVDLLRRQAQQRPDLRVYTFLASGEPVEAHLTCKELDRKARAVAASLQDAGAYGERALLLYPPGLDYIAAFFGCLYAGCAAVPTYPPRARRFSQRLQAIVADAKAKVVLTTTHILAALSRVFPPPPELASLIWMATDSLAEDLADNWREYHPQAGALAFLQYTSGSTATPKGVMVSHGNLLHNSALIQQCFDQSAETRSVIWLPPYHDMGLIGGILQPIFSGYPVTLLSPADFTYRPLCWLETISRTKATTSGGPNFAYDLCARKLMAQPAPDLDLSSWRVAFNGAEPLRPETLTRFAEACAPYGFRLESFYPCYGLAEATLLVSGGKRRQAPMIRRFKAAGLEQHLVNEEAGAGERALAGSGQCLSGAQVSIVGLEMKTVCDSGEIGEIWVAGPSVAQGYWGRPEESAEAFHATLAGSGEGPFLRTGDLGFIRDGELFVTGRLKDLIIIRGRNYYPQDIELAVEQSHPALKPSGGAAFSTDMDGEERLVVAQELGRRHKRLDLDLIIQAIRRAVAEKHQLQVQEVVLVREATLPKTSSGKVRRRACRSLFLGGELEVIRSSAIDTQAMEETSFIPIREQVLSAEGGQRLQLIETYLKELAARLLHISADHLDPQCPLIAMGLDSLMSVKLSSCLVNDLDVELPAADFFQSQSISQLASKVTDHLADSGKSTPPAPCVREIAPSFSSEYPLSPGQQALWFLQELSPESVAYNIAGAARIREEIDVFALRLAFQRLVDRHPALRTVFIKRQGSVMQRPLEQADVSFDLHDISQLTEPETNRLLVNEANRPFDLQTGPLLRVNLLTRSPQEHLMMLVAHHVVIDLWSLAVLIEELDRLYQAEKLGVAAPLSPLPAQYADYLQWQTETLAGPRGEVLDRYWRRQLAGQLPILNLPTDRPRPQTQTFSGGRLFLGLSQDLTAQVTTFSRAREATLYTTLLAAFQVLLHRYSGQDDILIGSPSAGRPSPSLERVVGYFVNPLVIREDLSGNPGFAEFLGRVKRTVSGAFEHREFPFAALVERLQPVRDPSRSPIFQVMFSLQNVPLLNDEGLAAFALGEEGARMELGSLALEYFPLQGQAAAFDLTLLAAERRGALGLSVQYNTDLFDSATIDRLLGHYQKLLESIIAAPETPVAGLPMLQSHEERQLLLEWNDTLTAYDNRLCAHQMFEAQVELTPEATAIFFNEERLTYRELNRRANRLAHRLLRLGVGVETIVGICIERSPELMVGLLGILKAGAAYVPLDPSYPAGRLAFILDDTGMKVLVTHKRLTLRWPDSVVKVDVEDALDAAVEDSDVENPDVGVTAENLAYAIFTSGSTGTPKGVLISHRNVVNFFAGMDRRFGCSSADTLLAVTSVSFDISVLELFWTLARGAKVLLLSETAVVGQGASQIRRKTADTKFSLFYFASDESKDFGEKYRLLLEGAKFADRHGFAAVWTPERHFHAFGGLYPNPVVTSAALATITEHVQLRAGSVVLPLHHPIRIAEEWSLVDNLSRGRVGVAFASGWHANDFVFFPENYSGRKELTFRGIETVRKLWRGEAIKIRSGSQQEIEVKIFPKPVQPELPVWVTAAGNDETFVKAGEIGAHVLTHLLGQTLDDLARKIKLYRDARAAHGQDPQTGQVALMLHTFIGESREAVREIVKKPFTNYLRSSVGLIASLISSLNLPLDLNTMSDRDIDDLLAFAFDRYFETGALFGAARHCSAMIERLAEIGVDEVACLIDFGVAEDEVLASLDCLKELQSRVRARADQVDHSLLGQAARHEATMLQCTPSTIRLLGPHSESLAQLKSLRTLMLGGEVLPPALADRVKEALPCRLVNMYGPTETTIWSATHEVEEIAQSIPIGRPIANTQLYILDPQARPVPVGVPGELYIGGDGVARGYLNRPDLTADKFVPHPFSMTPGGRLYRTGDQSRYLTDGKVEFLGRADHQVKFHGLRIELGEIEASLNSHPSVQEAVVLAREDTPGAERLVAYVVSATPSTSLPGELRNLLRQRLPQYMIPAVFMVMDKLPLTPNGKIDRRALPAPEGVRPELNGGYVPPRNRLEQTIAQIWQQALKLDKVGVYDNFFDLGGHSLLMAQVHGQLREILKRELPLIRLLEYPSIGALATYLATGEEGQSLLERNRERARRQRDGLNRHRIKGEAKLPGKG